LPLYHIFSLTANLLIFASLGGLNVLVPDPRDLRRLIATMRRTRVTAMSGVNTLFNALLNTPEFSTLDFSALKLAIGGGAAIQTAVVSRWQATTGTPLIEGYGLSEASPVVCINPPDGRARSGSVGLPIPSTELSIRDDEGRPVAVGEGGEIWVRGPQVMQSYWMRPDETRKVLTEDGWLQTGDVGMLDRDGFVKILDRKKDVIIVSGFKVFPNEVEEVVALCPGVLEAAAVGVPDERRGEAVKLFVVKRDPDLTEEAVRRHCRNNLTGYKLPKVIEFRNDLPKSNIGKILRKELR
jgi:long-chain acyl-CoA synthetase